MCFDYELQEWFDFEIPPTSIPRDFIEKSLETTDQYDVKNSSKLLWIGPQPVVSEDEDDFVVELYDRNSDTAIPMDQDLANWLVPFLDSINSSTGAPLTYNQMKSSFEEKFEDFTLFWYSEVVEELREFGLLVL